MTQYVTLYLAALAASTVLHMVLLVNASSSTSISAPHPRAIRRLASQGGTVNVKQMLQDITADNDAVKSSVWNFWAQHGVDGRAFTSFHQAGATSLAYPSLRSVPSSKDMAKTAFNFVAEHMHDPKDKMFYWAVSRDGSQVVRPNKALYGQMFTLYALGYHYRTFRNQTANALASACFTAMDSLWHNSTTGGYNELWSNSIEYAYDPSAPTKPDRSLPRTVNNMLHAIEGLVSYHRATLAPLALQRVTELMEIFCNKLDLVQGHLMSDYEPTTAASRKVWKPAVTATLSYGHNLEAAWLLSDAADYLQSIKAITPATRDSYYQRLMGIAQAALRDGYDQVNGGVFELGSPSKGPTSRVKVWWVQDETVLALYKMYKYFGEDPQYLTKLADTMRFIRTKLTDVKYGEQFWQVSEDGNYNITYYPGPGIKGNEWKASYHSGRSALYLSQWLKGRAADR